MEKEKAIGLIQGRIEDEYRKHSANIGNWAEIAARKLYSQWDEFFKKADASKPTVDKEELILKIMNKCDGIYAGMISRDQMSEFLNETLSANLINK